MILMNTCLFFRCRSNLDREENNPRHPSTVRVSPLLSGPLTPSNPSSVVSSDSGVHSNHSPSSHSEEATTPNHSNGTTASTTSTQSGIVKEVERRDHNDIKGREQHRESMKRISPAFDASSSDAKRSRLNVPFTSGGNQSNKSPPISPPLATSSARNAPWVTMGSTGSSYCQSSPECVSPSSQV